MTPSSKLSDEQKTQLLFPHMLRPQQASCDVFTCDAFTTKIVITSGACSNTFYCVKCWFCQVLFKKINTWLDCERILVESQQDPSCISHHCWQTSPVFSNLPKAQLGGLDSLRAKPSGSQLHRLQQPLMLKQAYFLCIKGQSETAFL